MEYSYSDFSNNEMDLKLIELVLEGNGYALEELIKKYQNFIYNIAFRMVLSPYDAEDITQEILIKIITKLETFKGKSSFKTWVGKITVNHVLNMKKKWLEERYKEKELYEHELDNIRIGELHGYSQPEKQILYEEARLGCLAGMLLCLSREQRIVYILGELFEVPGEICAEILSIAPATYRKHLSRARNDLYQFMNDKCGLVNPKNSCRCMKKTKGFIEAGWVDPTTMKFYAEHERKIYECLEIKDNQLKKIENFSYQNIIQSLPYIDHTISKQIVRGILERVEVKKIFNLGSEKNERTV
ncbi:MAG: RNA polymerase sigma factor [Lachnospiraceae bacterium]